MICKYYFTNRVVNDSQLYLRCQRQHTTTADQRLEMCITDVSQWIAAQTQVER